MSSLANDFQITEDLTGDKFFLEEAALNSPAAQYAMVFASCILGHLIQILLDVSGDQELIVYL